MPFTALHGIEIKKSPLLSKVFFMVSFLGSYETSHSYTSFPEAIYLANLGCAAHAAGHHYTQPCGAAHHSLGD